MLWAILWNSSVTIVTDDTQMTLFTANGLMCCAAAGGKDEKEYIYKAYLDWLYTQEHSMQYHPFTGKITIPRPESHTWNVGQDWANGGYRIYVKMKGSTAPGVEYADNIT